MNVTIQLPEDISAALEAQSPRDPPYEYAAVYICPSSTAVQAASHRIVRGAAARGTSPQTTVT